MTTKSGNPLGILRRRTRSRFIVASSPGFASPNRTQSSDDLRPAFEPQRRSIRRISQTRTYNFAHPIRHMARSFHTLTPSHIGFVWQIPPCVRSFLPSVPPGTQPSLTPARIGLVRVLVGKDITRPNPPAQVGIISLFLDGIWELANPPRPRGSVVRRGAGPLNWLRLADFARSQIAPVLSAARNWAVRRADADWVRLARFVWSPAFRRLIRSFKCDV